MTMELDKLFEKLGQNKMATIEPAEVRESVPMLLLFNDVIKMVIIIYCGFLTSLLSFYNEGNVTIHFYFP